MEGESKISSMESENTDLDYKLKIAQAVEVIEHHDLASD